MILRSASLFLISCLMMIASAPAGVVTYTLTGGSDLFQPEVAHF